MKHKSSLAFVVVLALVLLTSCVCTPIDSDLPPPPPPPIGVELPPYETAYASGRLYYEDGKREDVRLEDLDMAYYPHLNIKRDDFILKRAIFYSVPPHQAGIVALHQASQTGFIIEKANDVHGKFLFAPIESAEAALEYAKFMIHTVSHQRYCRYLYSPADFERAVNQMKKAGTVETIKTPPTTVTRVTEEGNGQYLVEFVSFCAGYGLGMEYSACRVSSDGGLELLDNFVFIKGPRNPNPPIP
ncbi:MAG: hypothetical protein FJZ93_05335 [Chloroflexi bacterium]|nr:hypothetical protein [Chloroflexota bacterium]MBM4450882.1 hypothetical protein [Chloroflexota bacterium]